MNTKNNNSDTLFGALIDAGFNDNLAKLITAQAAHETDNFKSDLFINYNNPFGMKQPTTRQTTSLGATLTGYASYSDLFSAAQDYYLYWKALGYPDCFNTTEDFVAALKEHNYYEDFEVVYLAGVNHFYKMYFS